METQNLNQNAEMNGTENGQKKSNVKKTAGKAAQMAGAVGVGVAGTMAAEAYAGQPDDVEVVEEVVGDAAGGHAAGTEGASEEVETPAEFDVNDIRLDNVETGEVGEVIEESDNDLVMDMTDEPIDAGNEFAMVDVDDITIDDNIADPDGMPMIDPTEDLMADTGIDADPDILGDILEA